MLKYGVGHFNSQTVKDWQVRRGCSQWLERTKPLSDQTSPTKDPRDLA